MEIVQGRLQNICCEELPDQVYVFGFAKLINYPGSICHISWHLLSKWYWTEFWLGLKNWVTLWGLWSSGKLIHCFIDDCFSIVQCQKAIYGPCASHDQHGRCKARHWYWSFLCISVNTHPVRCIFSAARNISSQKRANLSRPCRLSAFYVKRFHSHGRHYKNTFSITL